MPSRWPRRVAFTSLSFLTRTRENEPPKPIPQRGRRRSANANRTTLSPLMQPGSKSAAADPIGSLLLL